MSFWKTARFNKQCTFQQLYKLISWAITVKGTRPIMYSTGLYRIQNNGKLNWMSNPALINFVSAFLDTSGEHLLSPDDLSHTWNVDTSSDWAMRRSGYWKIINTTSHAEILRAWVNYRPSLRWKSFAFFVNEKNCSCFNLWQFTFCLHCLHSFKIPDIVYNIVQTI